MTAVITSARPAAFSRLGAFALVTGGFALFLAMLWLIGADADFGGERGGGQAHAAGNGLNGYAGLVRLVEAQGYAVQRSRNRADLETYGLLVITPSFNADPEEVAEILETRRFLGPTLVILPKWWTRVPAPNLPPEIRARFKKGWVMLGPPSASQWPEELPAPYRFEHRIFPKPPIAAIPGKQDPRSAKPAKPAQPAPPPPPGRWRGMGRVGVLPAASTLHAALGEGQQALIIDDAGRVLAFGLALGAEEEPEAGTASNADDDTARSQPVIVLAEPDLANNYGLADPARAAVAIALIDELAAGDDIDEVTFDLTLNGFGASENLLTLAFRPPFLAATLSLLVALLIVGWRAFQRFGPPVAAAGPDIAYGKRQLILNGAGLIVRARRFRLLAKPYVALSARRLAERLGLSRPDPQAIDAAVARRLPAEEPFTHRAARLETAVKPAEILAAAQGLDELATKLAQGQTSA